MGDFECFEFSLTRLVGDTKDIWIERVCASYPQGFHFEDTVQRRCKNSVEEDFVIFCFIQLS